MKEIHHWIDGKEYKGTSGRFSDVFNPATGEVQARLSLATKAELDHAVERAAEAQVKWGATNPQRRARVMMEFVRLINRDMDKMAEVLSSYSGPVVGMSFDPDQVLALRETMPNLPRGITAQRTYDDSSWTKLTPAQRDGMLYLRHGFRTEPHFVAFWVNQLPAPAPWIARNVFGCPLLAWTVRTAEQRARAARYADQMIFEGFVPGT